MSTQTETAQRLSEAYTEFDILYSALQALRDADLDDNTMIEMYTQLSRRSADLFQAVGADFTDYSHRQRIRAREARRLAQLSSTPAVTLPAESASQPVVVALPVEPVYTSRRTKQRRAHLTKVISLSELNATLVDPCSICFESYTRSNSVLTSCQHSFCKDCFSAHEKSGARVLSCPLCREVNFRVTEFRQRKPRQPRSHHNLTTAATLPSLVNETN